MAYRRCESNEYLQKNVSRDGIRCGLNERAHSFFHFSSHWPVWRDVILYATSHQLFYDQVRCAFMFLFFFWVYFYKYMCFCACPLQPYAFIFILLSAFYCCYRCRYDGGCIPCLCSNRSLSYCVHMFAGALILIIYLAPLWSWPLWRNHSRNS